jgi:NitT/TauT family transport system substrate-binding protein
MRLSRPFYLAAAAATALVLAACGSPAAVSGSGTSGGGKGGGKSMSMTIGYTAIGAAYSDLYVCQDQGIFKKNGLTVKLTLLNSSSQLFAALASNSVQIGAGVARSTAAGSLGANVPLKYIALPIPRLYLEAWGKQSIKSPDQLKGKKIGLSSPGSLGDASVDAFLADQGWTDKDVKKTFLKSTPAEVTALEHGAVDVIVTQPPTGTQTRSKGFRKVMDFTKYKAAANAYTMKADYLKANRPAAAAFVKSEVECLSILHNNEKMAIASIRKHSGSDDPALAKYAYDFFNPLWAKVPTVDPALLDAAFKQAAIDSHKPAPADISTYVDNSMLQKLQSDGFVDSLYKK